jgi:ketosteroid isomerase-like protein
MEMNGLNDKVRDSIDSQVGAYLSAFNRMDLDEVMNYFADDAVYKPGDGSVYRGKRAIRHAFTPQFAHAFGTMVFDEEDRIVEAEAGKVMLSWTCIIDAQGLRFFSLTTWLRRTLGRLKFGRKAQWRGLDLLYFNSERLIVKKLTYANYAALLLTKG